MSKYEELWNTFIDGEKRFTRYQEEAGEFAGRFANGLLEFLGCRQNDLRLVPLGDKQDLEKACAVLTALNYDDDGYWSMGIFLAIRSPHNGQPETINFGPQAGFLFRFSMRKEKNRFQLRTPDGKHVELDLDSNDDRVAYYELMVADMKKTLANDLGLHTKRTHVRRIGFDAAQ